MKISVFVRVHIKTIPWKFNILILRILELFTVKFVNCFKSRLLFNVFYCFWMFVSKLFIYLACAYLRVKGVLMWNLQHIIFIWRRRYWQIFKSALVCLQPVFLFCKLIRSPIFAFWYQDDERNIKRGSREQQVARNDKLQYLFQK